METPKQLLSHMPAMAARNAMTGMPMQLLPQTPVMAGRKALTGMPAHGFHQNFAMSSMLEAPRARR